MEYMSEDCIIEYLTGIIIIAVKVPRKITIKIGKTTIDDITEKEVVGCSDINSVIKEKHDQSVHCGISMSWKMV